MKKKTFIIVGIILLVGLIIGCYFMKENKTSNYTSDEIKFKEEYESLNGKEVFENYILKNLVIDSDNNVTYLNDNNLIEKLSSGTNVIYFGWPECNWCRTVLPVLFNTLKTNNINNLYYYNLKDLRTSFENGTDNKKIELYNKVIDIIGEDITTIFENELESNGKKKILAPTIVFIKDGKYVGQQISSVSSQKKATDELTDDQVKELSSIYQTLIDKLQINVCDEGC